MNTCREPTLHHFASIILYALTRTASITSGHRPNDSRSEVYYTFCKRRAMLVCALVCAQRVVQSPSVFAWLDIHSRCCRNAFFLKDNLVLLLYFLLQTSHGATRSSQSIHDCGSKAITIHDS